MSPLRRGGLLLGDLRGGVVACGEEEGEGDECQSYEAASGWDVVGWTVWVEGNLFSSWMIVMRLPFPFSSREGKR